MSRSLDDLCPACRPLFDKFLELAEENFNFDMVVVDVLRTPEQQAANIAKGVSWTAKSKHLPQPGCNKSHALDAAPAHLMSLKNWAPSHPDWERLGVMAESLGLNWGGRWKQRDCPHVESVCKE